MEVRELRKAVEKVQIKSEMEEEILKNVINMENEHSNKNMNKRRKTTGWQGKAVAVVIALAVAGAGGFTVHAVVENLAQQRLESMSKEEVETLAEDNRIRQAEAGTYSRELTDKEMERERELSIAYQKGQFPESELNKVQDKSEIDKDALCYVLPTGYMYLPDRELTDEEILQMIDYYEKMNYAIEEQYKEKYPEEEQEWEDEQRQLKEQIEAEGGISEEEAVAKAQEWLKKLYGEDGEGMKMGCCIWSVQMAEEVGWEAPDGKPFYDVDYAIEGVEYFDFKISSVDGTLICSEYSSGFDKETSLSNAEGKIQEMYQKAEEYLQDIVNIPEEYTEVYCRYAKSDDGNSVFDNMVDFWFVKEDRSARVITVKCGDMKFAGYNTGNYDEYSQEREESEKAGESIVTKVK